MDQAETYMRQRDVQFSCANLMPYADNLQLYFDNKLVPVAIDGITGAAAGSTVANSVKADAKGVARGHFTVPANVPCGTKEVSLKNINNTGTASYTASGRLRTTEVNVIHERVTVQESDPLAQAFQYDDDRIVSSVGLYFASTDPSNQVNVQIRNMVNGYPGTTIYAEKLISASDIKTTLEVNLGNDSLSETKVTFPTPVLCKAGTQYCIVTAPIVTGKQIGRAHV